MSSVAACREISTIHNQPNRDLGEKQSSTFFFLSKAKLKWKTMMLLHQRETQNAVQECRSVAANSKTRGAGSAKQGNKEPMRVNSREIVQDEQRPGTQDEAGESTAN